MDTLDLSDLAPAETFDLSSAARHGPTGWVITLAGPAHPQTIALNARSAAS